MTGPREVRTVTWPAGRMSSSLSEDGEKPPAPPVRLESTRLVVLTCFVFVHIDGSVSAIFLFCCVDCLPNTFPPFLSFSLFTEYCITVSVSLSVIPLALIPIQYHGCVMCIELKLCHGTFRNKH